MSSLTAMERLVSRKRTHAGDVRGTQDSEAEFREGASEFREGASTSSGGSPDSDSGTETHHAEEPSEYRPGGYHPAAIGDRYHNKYILEKKLGFGYFSTVWLASDETRAPDDPHKIVAIKIAKSSATFQEAAQDETKFLQALGQHAFVVQLLDQFVIWGPHGKHYCLVFEPMWKDLFYLIRRFDYRGVPLKLLKVLAYQILCGVEYLHEKQIIHTDIKPENFLLSLPFDLRCEALQQEREQYLGLREQYRRSQATPTGSLSRNQRKRLKEKRKGRAAEAETTDNIAATGGASWADLQAQMHRLEHLKSPSDLAPTRRRNLIIKVADLGNACWTHKHFTSDITTRQYRSPEALLGYPYGTGVDIFACGVMVFELATGELLFRPPRGPDPYHRNEIHLASMYRTLGYLPRYMIKDGKYSSHYFNRRCEFRRHSMEALEPRPLEDLLRHYGYDPQDLPQFVDWLRHVLEPDPRKRWTATQAKHHPWLADVHAAYTARGLEAFSLDA